ncbi:methyltransferase-like protein 7A [Bradysia coprophila]|uniref:methyltransferase-like protein 7A n=1 Tax=Bradysia coprophila TaxID=38358 RepID=UPI00187D9A3D|nr:methyltransferase-like protein 7A [Bradysia coprophila]
MSKKSISWKSFDLLNFLKAIVSTVRSFLFAFTYPKFVELVYNENVIEFKQEVFADIGLVIPSKKTGQITILEVGVGPGFNLDYYPKKCRLIALDKNPHFKKVLLQNLHKHPEITLEKFVHERAENMASIPSNSIDVVVTSNVHCSVDNSQKVLKEIRRVLVPGGRYYFFEHCLDEPGTTRFKWQKFVNKIRLWQFIGHGCVFSDFESIFSKFGLFNFKGKRYTIDTQSWTYYASYLVASNYGGYAVKEK